MESVGARTAGWQLEVSSRGHHVDDGGVDRIDSNDRMASRSKGVPTEIDAKNATSGLARRARSTLHHVQHGLGKRLAIVRRLGQHILDPAGASQPRVEILLEADVDGAVVGNPRLA